MADGSPPSSPAAANDAIAAANRPPPLSDHPHRLPPPSRRLSAAESAISRSTPASAGDGVNFEPFRLVESRRVSLDPPLPPSLDPDHTYQAHGCPQSC